MRATLLIEHLLRSSAVPEERWAMANKAVSKWFVSSCTGIRVPLQLRPPTPRAHLDSAWVPDVSPIFVAKAVTSARGEGIAVVQRERHGWLVDGGALDMPELVSRLAGLGSHIFAEEHISSHPALRALCPVGELVDLRLVFVGGQFLIGRMRVPTVRSQGYGNVARGAFAVCLDENGRATGYHPYQTTGAAVHPDTGVNLEGFQLPAWPSVLTEACRVAELLASPQVSVDGTIDADGRFVLIEVTLIPAIGWLSTEGRKHLRGAILRCSERQSRLPRWFSETPHSTELLTMCQPCPPNQLKPVRRPALAWW